MHHGPKLPVFQLQSKPPPAFRQDPVHMGATMMKVLRWRPTTNGYRGSLPVAWKLWGLNAVSDHFWTYHRTIGARSPQPSSWLSGTRTCPENLHALNWLNPLDLLVWRQFIRTSPPRHLTTSAYLSTLNNPHSAPTEINSKHCLSPHPRYQQKYAKIAFQSNLHTPHIDFALFHRHTRGLFGRSFCIARCAGCKWPTQSRGAWPSNPSHLVDIMCRAWQP